MSNMIDLSLLSEETIDFNFHGTVFRVPPEPTIGFSKKMLVYKSKMEKARTDEERMDILSEVVAIILKQDDTHTAEDVDGYVDQMSVRQVEAVFNIYENQTIENANNPN